MKVSDILDRKGRDVVTVNAAVTVLEAAARLRAENVGAAPVTDDDGEMVGILSERDIIDAVARMGEKALKEPVTLVMTTPVLTCAPAHHIRSVMATMTERRVRHLPVVEDGRLAGIVSIGDALKPRLEEAELEMRVLRDMARAGLAY